MPKTAPTMKLCQWGCGKTSRPGPMAMHEKSCPKNPNPPPQIEQPMGQCRYCGYSTTVGALANHEKYGCPKRTNDPELGRLPCPTCGKKFLPGPLAVHAPACKGS